MAYGETKVYFDGSHYIAIPHTERKLKRRPKPPEEVITVKDIPKETVTENAEENVVANAENAAVSTVESTVKQVVEQTATSPQKAVQSPKTERKMTKKELFDELYKANVGVSKAKRRKNIVAAMRQYFDSVEDAELFVDRNLERKQRNLICRRIRMMRKANLADFNYFVTFTYSDALHTEESFRKKLKNKLALLAYRQGWKYMGVWERSPEKHRLHFHGLFNIPQGTLPGEMTEVNDYNFNTHKRQITHQNTYFTENFGRNDFDEIDDKGKLGNALAYLMKYIEKTGEKIVYSKGLPQFFISDIMDEDILCGYGVDEGKLLLYDDFVCWDEGLYMGKVSSAVIAQMRKSNN